MNYRISLKLADWKFQSACDAAKRKLRNGETTQSIHYESIEKALDEYNRAVWDVLNLETESN